MRVEFDEATKNVIIEANNLETAIKNAETTYTKLGVWEAECRTDSTREFFASERKKVRISVEQMAKELAHLRL